MNKKTMVYVVAGVVLVVAIIVIVISQGMKMEPAGGPSTQPVVKQSPKSETELNKEIAKKLNLNEGQLPLRVTMDDNNQTASFTPGKNITLMLGTDYEWTLTSSNEQVLSKRSISADDPRVQGIYQVVGEGSSVLSGQGKCKSGVQCAAPTAQFKFTVEGLVSENVKPEDAVK